MIPIPFPVRALPHPQRATAVAGSSATFPRAGRRPFYAESLRLTTVRRPSVRQSQPGADGRVLRMVALAAALALALTPVLRLHPR